MSLIGVSHCATHGTTGYLPDVPRTTHHAKPYGCRSSTALPVGRPTGA